MFATGATFICECSAFEESADGFRDVAVCVLRAQVHVGSTDGGKSESLPDAVAALAIAQVALKPVTLGARLFCIGNPSSVDLESTRQETIDFFPPTFREAQTIPHISLTCRESFRLF